MAPDPLEQRELVITRRLKAPRSLVWRTFADPYLLAQWWGRGNELVIESLGHQGLGWDGEGYGAGELAALRSMLRSKANSIEGGSSEINLNVVSKRVLGLPDPK